MVSGQSAGGQKKKLLATTDYYDNIIGQSEFFSRKHLDDLHAYLCTLGVTRHQWMYNTGFNFYDQDAGRMDLLAEAAASAHRHGLEFYAVLKPFEGGGTGVTFPHSLPLPEGAVAVKDIRGLFTNATPFLAKHPHLCLQRRPDPGRCQGPVAAIRLVKGDDQPTRIQKEHLSIWTSSCNNGFRRYQGPISFRESVEWRPCFPKSKFCRVLHLEGLALPADQTYILVRCAVADSAGDFTNERGSIIELENRQGQSVPFMMSSGPVAYEAHRKSIEQLRWLEIMRYLQLPSVRALFQEPEQAKKHYQDFYGFDERHKWTALHTLDQSGYIAVACGKQEYMTGNLHPIYPEVRRHWLEMARYCLDRGVDGINIRTSNHVRSPEAWEYGFNEPVLQAAGGRSDYPTIRRINGDAYTLFLREARDLVKSRGKSLTVHLYSQMLLPDDRPEQLYYIPPNFDWQWQTWVREIADDLEFRGAWTLRPWNLRQVIETFSAVTKAAGKPFYFQGNMKELGLHGPYHFTRQELETIVAMPEVDGFVLYETANFTRMNKTGGLDTSTDLANLMQNYFRPS